MVVSAELVADLPKTTPEAELQHAEAHFRTYTTKRWAGELVFRRRGRPMSAEQIAKQLKAERDLIDAFRRLKRRARYHFGHFQYLSRMEITTRGRPRMVLITTCLELDRTWLSRNWRECGGTRIADYKTLQSIIDVLEACKAFQYPTFNWRSQVLSSRKVRYTKGFFRDLEPLNTTEKAILSDWLKRQENAAESRFDHNARMKFRWIRTLANVISDAL